MSILKEIHEQPEGIRLVLFGLSCVTILSFVGYMWYTSFERAAYIALNPEEGAERYARVAQQRPDPISTVRKGVNSATANIGSFIGFDRSKGFDVGSRSDDDQDRVYLLPLSD